MMGHLMVVLFTNYSKKKKKPNKSLTNIYMVIYFMNMRLIFLHTDWFTL